MVFSWKTVLDGAKVVKKYAIRYAPQILTGVGIACMAGATVHAVHTAPIAKAHLTLIDDDPNLSHKDYILKKTRCYAEFYWPTLLMTFGGAGMIIGGQHISLKRLGMATAIIGSQREELKDLKDKIAEKYGNKELGKIQDEITQDKVKNEAERKHLDISTVYNTGKGTTLCYDVYHGFFLSDLEYIRQMRDAFNNDIAEQMQHGHESVMSLNDWYEYIGLEPLDGCVNGKKFGPDIGKDMGWRNRTMQLRFTAGLLDNDQTYMVVGFTESGAPKWDLDISDDYGQPYTDDETDTPWRGR